jgi:microcystin-dependent protein
MSTPYLAQIMIAGFNFAPKGWQLCNGQVLSISQNAALFSLLGTTFGGNGTSTFQLPNLQGSTPIHMGTPPGGQTYVEGATGGLANVTLLSNQIPLHTHQAKGVSTTANLEPAAGNAWANSAQNPYAATANATMNGAVVQAVGGSQPHPNQPPYLVLNFVIALAGIFPSRS